MSSNAAPILIEKITYYREAQVVVLTPKEGPEIIFREQVAADQYLDLEKKLKSSAEVPEPVLIGNKEFSLAPTLTIDAISGPVFWEEIASSRKLKI